MRSAFFSLITRSRLSSLLVVQFLGAFNDNLFKNALVILMVFSGTLQTGIDNKILVTVAAGMFILPYVLFSATAGQLADKYEKAFLVRIIKWVELVLMSLVALGFYIENAWLLMAVLFAMGAQSAFFSPLKYSLVPDYLPKDEVLAGNAIIEGSTFISILMGTIAGGILAGMPEYMGIPICSAALVLLAGVGVFASYRLQPAGPYEPALHVRANMVAATWHLMRDAFRHPVVAHSIMCISWFWLIGAAFLSQFPAIGKDVLGGNESVVTTLLTGFSIGIAIGSFLAHKLLRGVVSLKYAPIALLVMTAAIGDLYFVCDGLIPREGMNAAMFLQDWRMLRIAFDLLMVAVCGGIYVVPLNTMLQTHSAPDIRARMIGANNVMNSIFMVLASVVITVLLLANFSIPAILLLIALGNLPMAWYVRKIR